MAIKANHKEARGFKTKECIMRLLIDTSGIQFRVAGAAKPRPDFQDRDRQATTRDGEPIWTVRLDAIDPDREARTWHAGTQQTP
jgi:hypothetical protein